MALYIKYTRALTFENLSQVAPVKKSAESAEMQAEEDKVHVGPFSKEWYGRDTAIAPRLCSRSDCLYILFNMATLDFSRGHWPSGRSLSVARMADMSVEALLRVTDSDDADCCNLQTLMMMHALQHMLTPLHLHKSSSSAAQWVRSALLRDALDAIAIVGTHILHVVSSDRKMASLFGSSLASEVFDSDGQSQHRVDDVRGRARAVERGMRSGQGLFTLAAAVSAILHVCTCSGEAAVQRLRNDPNFLHFLFAVLSVLHDAGLQADGARPYQDALVFPDTALFVLRQPLFSDLRLQYKTARQASSAARIRNVSNQIFERLFARLRCECAAALMHVCWSCLPHPLLVRLASLSHDNSPGIRGIGEWALEDSLAQALAHGTITASLLPRKVLVDSVQAAGAPHLILGLLADHTSLSVDTMNTRIGALHVLGAILLREAWSGCDAYVRSCASQLLVALSRLLLLPHALEAAPSQHGASATIPQKSLYIVRLHSRYNRALTFESWCQSFCCSLAAILAILCLYVVPPSLQGQPKSVLSSKPGTSASMQQWLMQRGAQQSHLSLLVSSCVSFVGVASTSSVAASMVLRFLQTFAACETGCQTILQAVANAGMYLCRSFVLVLWFFLCKPAN